MDGTRRHALRVPAGTGTETIRGSPKRRAASSIGYRISGAGTKRWNPEGKETGVARQTPVDRIRRLAKNFETPGPKGLSKARKKIKRMEMPRPKGLSKATDKLKGLEIPKPRLRSGVRGKLNKAQDIAEEASPKELQREIKRRRQLETALAAAKARPKKRRRSLKNRLLRFGVVSSLGALVMYLFDPERGQARRKEMSKKVDDAISGKSTTNKPSGAS